MVIRLKDAVGAFTSKVSVVGAYYDIASGQVEWLADRIARGYPRIDANATTWPDAWAANN